VTPRAAVRLAWGLWGLATGLIAAGLAVNTVQVATGEEGILAVLSLVFITTGAFLAGRRPANPVGWLLLGWGMVMAFGSFTGAYVNRGLVRDPGSLPGPSWVGWAEGVIWHPAFGLLAFLLLLFPHGRLPSPRWRPFAWFTVGIYVALSLAAALAPGSVELYYPEATPPVRLPVAGLADVVFEWLLPGQLLVLATALMSLVLRLRRASGEERQQVKWFVYTVVTVVLVFVTTTLALGGGYLFPLFGLIPVSVAVAVFKYRLYDIDRLTNHPGLRAAHRRADRRLRRPGVPARRPARPGHRRLRPGRGRLHPGRGRPVPAGSPPGPGVGRPAVQPPPLRRRPHRRALQRPSPRPGRP
jgi:hypothetical protein